ncbi:MAG: hypothetical protein HQ581_04665, partial [Planctomycetes bacterium]|nr:hypothetical protein [Planctomycetota bacterium]
RQIATVKRWDWRAGLFVLSVGIVFWPSADAVAGELVGGNVAGAGLRASLEQLAEVDDDAGKAFGTSAATTSGSVLQHGDTVLVAYEAADGDVVSRQFVESAWSPPVPVTASAPRRDGERWDMPSLVAGPDDCVWIAYRSEVRRRVFLHRWLGESWGPRIDGRGIFCVSPSADGSFGEELRPISGFVVEGSRVRDAIEMRFTSSDDPPVVRIESIPMVALKAAPGEGAIFIDARDVARTSGLRWQEEQPLKHPNNPLLSPTDNPDAPDAVRVFNRGTVRCEKGRFRMWYSATGTDSPINPGQPVGNWQRYMRVCYAESEDGIHWQRPELGLVEFKGSLRNNVLPVVQRCPTVIHDRHEPDPDRRYKCFGNAARMTREEGHLMTSTDGLHWRYQPSPRRYPGTRPYWPSEFHSVFRDDRERDPERLWKAYGLYATGPTRRASQLSTSPDGVHWTGYAENPIVDPLQGVSPCIHDFLVWPEMGRYVGLLQVGDALHNYEWELMVSRDGVHFSRVSDGRPFLGRGEAGKWDQGGIQAAIPVRVGDQSWFYYGGREKPWSTYPGDPNEIWTFKSHCGLATMGVGRYAGFRVAEKPQRGILDTRPIHCEFDRELTLTVNSLADAQSPIRVAVVDAATGQPLEGYSLDACRAIEVDGVSQPVGWADLSRVKLQRDRPVRLQFELRGRQSRLYGFAWQRDKEQ